MRARGGASPPPGCDGSGRAADILDNETLTKLVREDGGKHPRELIGRPPGRIWHDDCDGAARILLRPCWRRQGKEAKQGRWQTCSHKRSSQIAAARLALA